MERKKLKNGFEMPVFGLGTWTMGGRFEEDSTHDESDISAIKNAIDHGITHIDTAEAYASGHAEELVGKAIQGYDRSKLFIVSKVKSANLHHDNILKSAKASLKRLNISYLDLYLLHAPNPNVPIQESMKALDELAEEGLIKSYGVSNFNIKRFEEAQSYAKRKIVANQLHYNLIIRESEKNGMLKYCQENDIMFIAWRPVQKGILAEETELMKQMSQKYHKTHSQIAINWLISQPNIVTLSKMSNPSHLEENLGAVGWKMEEEDIERLRKEFPGQQNKSDAVQLI